MYDNTRLEKPVKVIISDTIFTCVFLEKCCGSLGLLLGDSATATFFPILLYWIIARNFTPEIKRGLNALSNQVRNFLITPFIVHVDVFCSVKIGF